MALPIHELPTHVGGFYCSSLFVDQAVMSFIEHATDDDRRVNGALAALDEMARADDQDTANIGKVLAVSIRDGLLAS